MAYFIYQNIPNRRVMIHRGECHFCNDWHGVQPNPLGNANGQWFIAPNMGYEVYWDAVIVAQQLANNLDTDFRNCQRCQPNII